MGLIQDRRGSLASDNQVIREVRRLSMGVGLTQDRRGSLAILYIDNQVTGMPGVFCVELIKDRRGSLASDIQVFRKARRLAMGVDLKQERRGSLATDFQRKLVCNDAGCILCTVQVRRISTKMLFA